MGWVNRVKGMANSVRVAANKALNPIAANEAIEPLWSKGLGKVSSSLRLTEPEVAGRKYYHNQAINKQLAELKGLKKEGNQVADNLGLGGKYLDEYNKGMRADMADLDFQKYGFMDIATDYMFGSGSLRRNLVRQGTAIGAVAVGSVGVRMASGGSLTRDRKGRKDIAGIPFV